MSATTTSILVARVRRIVRELVREGRITDARDWIDSGCPPSARAFARLELDRRTGTRSAS